MSLPVAVYRPRNPQLSDYYRCVEDYFETFVRVYEEYFSRLYGFWRPYVEQVIYRFLDCGDPHNGFARVKCKDCGHECLLAFSCKRRHFCPSCHQKRVVEFGEWLCMDVLKKRRLATFWDFILICTSSSPMAASMAAGACSASPRLWN